jgi:hypothetical protein
VKPDQTNIFAPAVISELEKINNAENSRFRNGTAAAEGFIASVRTSRSTSPAATLKVAAEAL